MAANGVILQSFQWHTPIGTLYRHLIDHASAYAARGYTAVWFPPPGKGTGGPFGAAHDVGYGAHDLFDLGEFDQKQSIPTKYGTRQQLLDAVKAVQRAGMQAYLDVVFNHKDGGDGEEVVAQEVDPRDRNRSVGPWRTIKAFTKFDFPARGGRYSTMAWRSHHFDVVGWDGYSEQHGRIYRLKDKHFETEVSPEHGNYDFLMACDLETGHPEVDGELRWWGRWVIDTTGADGFRLDAVKHIRAGFFRDWVNHLRTHFGGRELFTVGEHWSPHDVQSLHDYITMTQGVMSLFDVPLHQRLCDASRSGSRYDLRTIFDRTLVKEQPAKAVSFVDNHDTQPGGALESWVEPWFKPHAYALILLRRDGYPCVFAGDLADWEYEHHGRYVKLWDHGFLIDRFLRARREYGFGDQYDYLDHPNTIGWTRLGDAQHPGAMAVVLTNGSDGNKWMEVRRANAPFTDGTGHVAGRIVTNENGWGNFTCPAGSVSVWLQD